MPSLPSDLAEMKRQVIAQLTDSMTSLAQLELLLAQADERFGGSAFYPMKAHVQGAWRAIGYATGALTG